MTGHFWKRTDGTKDTSTTIALIDGKEVEYHLMDGESREETENTEWFDATVWEYLGFGTLHSIDGVVQK